MIDLCEELDNVTFCMSSRDWSGCMALDGLHLNAAGTRQLATLFVQVLTQLLTESSKSTSKIELRSSLDFPPLCDGGSDILTSSASPLYSEVVAESALSRKLPSQLNVKAPSETEQQLQTREFQQCSSAAVTQKNLKENSELSSFLRKSAHPDPNGWIHVGRKRFTQNIEQCCQLRKPCLVSPKHVASLNYETDPREFHQCSSVAVTQKNLKENSELSSFLRKSAPPDPNGWIHVGRKRFTQNIEQCCQFRNFVRGCKNIIF
ncbi:uncharacterized protein LOC118180190 [Stegodyphus dumicola]|uniref:uncharacterized protein LOC118180190 n=1 Tax=Stegodyphus dumicola TaxID=202533 RepID=UPI0015AFEF88|nr:uncharacterized protein LOC118180190 [Stegodyphus dumicola]